MKCHESKKRRAANGKKVKAEREAAEKGEIPSPDPETIDYVAELGDVEAEYYDFEATASYALRDQRTVEPGDRETTGAAPRLVVFVMFGGGSGAVNKKSSRGLAYAAC